MKTYLLGEVKESPESSDDELIQTLQQRTCIDVSLYKLLLTIFLPERHFTPQLKADSKCCTKRRRPRGQAIPLYSTSGLTSIYGFNAFYNSFELWVSRVWSLLLLSFIGNDLFYYYSYPDERFNQTLFNIFFTHAEHEKSLTAGLIKPSVWPELFLIPFVWGLIKAFRERCRAKQLSAEQIQILIAKLDNYHPSCSNDIFKWLMPIYPLRDAINVIQRALLWDNRLSTDQRRLLFNALLKFHGRSKKYSHIYSLKALGNIAEGVDLRDLDFLKQQQIAETILQALLHAKLTVANVLRQEAIKSKSLINSSLAKYLLWQLGINISYGWRPLFAIYKLIKFYFKAKFFYTLYLGISELIKNYLAKQACLSANKLWLYMNMVATYECSVCGDLPIFYRNIFDPSSCLQDYLRLPRNASDIVLLLNRLDLTGVNFLDFSHQQFADDLPDILAAIPMRMPDLQALYLNATNLILGPNSLIALNNYLKYSSVTNLSLRGQQIGYQGMAALTNIANSQLENLDLAYSFIQADGAIWLANNINPQLETLDLFGCFIQDAGLSAIGHKLPNSKLQRVYLGVNNITDAGLESVAQDLESSNLRELDLWGNAICSSGAISLAQSIPLSLIKLDIHSNPCLGSDGVKAIAKTLRNSNLAELNLAFVNMQTDGALALAEYIFGAQLQILNIRSNNIDAIGVQALAQAFNRFLLSVDLSYNQIGLLGAQALRAAIPNTNIQQLLLENVELDDESLIVLTPVLEAQQLTSIVLANNYLSDRAAIAIAKTLSNSGLKLLDLANNNIGDLGASALGHAVANATLEELSLALNRIQMTGAIEFSRALYSKYLRTLDLTSNLIGDGGGCAVGQALRYSRLRSLNMGGCELQSPTALAISASLPDSQLEFLALDYNDMDDRGGTALAGVLTTVEIPHRQQWIDSISDDARRALAAANPNTHLQYLNLAGNDLTALTAKGLCRVLPQTDIAIGQLNLDGNPINSSLVDTNNCFISSANRLQPSPIIPIFLWLITLGVLFYCLYKLIQPVTNLCSLPFRFFSNRNTKHLSVKIGTTDNRPGLQLTK